MIGDGDVLDRAVRTGRPADFAAWVPTVRQAMGIAEREWLVEAYRREGRKGVERFFCGFGAMIRNALRKGGCSWTCHQLDDWWADLVVEVLRERHG
jgi:hypothetical protein